MNTKKLNDLIGGTPSISAPFTPALNNIRGEGTLRKMLPKKSKDVGKNMPMKKPGIKQYGDKGYKPSNGTGVGM